MIDMKNLDPMLRQIEVTLEIRIESHVLVVSSYIISVLRY